MQLSVRAQAGSLSCNAICTNAFDRPLEAISGLYRTDAFRRAGVNEIARLQVVELRQMGDHRGDAVNQQR